MKSIVLTGLYKRLAFLRLFLTLKCTEYGNPGRLYRDNQKGRTNERLSSAWAKVDQVSSPTNFG